MSSVYKFHPSDINLLRDKYPQIDLTYIVDGVVSNRINETKANAMQARHNNLEYLITYYSDSDGSRCYELTKTGVVMDTLIGTYKTSIDAVMRILEL